MTMQITKNDLVDATTGDNRSIDELYARRRIPLIERHGARIRALFGAMLPPIIVLAILLGLWQLICIKPSSSLPSPARIWSEANDLILHPFFIAGRRISASAGACSHLCSASRSASDSPASPACCSV